MRVDGRMTRHLAGGLPASLFALDNQPCGPILLDTRIEVQEIFSLLYVIWGNRSIVLL
jgi:hypothetical protein